MLILKREEDFAVFYQAAPMKKSYLKSFVKGMILSMTFISVTAGVVFFQYEQYQQKYFVSHVSAEQSYTFEKLMDKLDSDLFQRNDMTENEQLQKKLLVEDFKNLSSMDMTQEQNQQIIDSVNYVLKNTHDMQYIDRVKEAFLPGATQGTDKEILLAQEAQYCSEWNFGCQIALRHGLAQALQDKVMRRNNFIEHEVQSIEDNTIGEHL